MTLGEAIANAGYEIFDHLEKRNQQKRQQAEQLAAFEAQDREKRYKRTADRETRDRDYRLKLREIDRKYAPKPKKKPPIPASLEGLIASYMGEGADANDPRVQAALQVKQDLYREKPPTPQDSPYVMASRVDKATRNYHNDSYQWGKNTYRPVSDYPGARPDTSAIINQSRFTYPDEQSFLESVRLAIPGYDIRRLRGPVPRETAAPTLNSSFQGMLNQVGQSLGARQQGTGVMVQTVRFPTQEEYDNYLRMIGQ